MHRIPGGDQRGCNREWPINSRFARANHYYCRSLTPHAESYQHNLKLVHDQTTQVAPFSFLILCGSPKTVASRPAGFTSLHLLSPGNSSMQAKNASRQHSGHGEDESGVLGHMKNSIPSVNEMNSLQHNNEANFPVPTVGSDSGASHSDNDSASSSDASVDETTRDDGIGSPIAFSTDDNTPGNATSLNGDITTEMIDTLTNSRAYVRANHY